MTWGPRNRAEDCKGLGLLLLKTLDVTASDGKKEVAQMWKEGSHRTDYTEFPGSGHRFAVDFFLSSFPF